ncbi:hypothetical protein Pmani_021920 [Petrolisthes manimaculis]|uniref:Protein male-specific lethal-3 n=1 Tax=Petrolisthes manimaculis TaxID=1843537 RepID=A0AAE1PF79_9EUCA|nr:hypothetical protein Pmani_021920 [Petrolisthes manimaculis]
MGLVCSGRWVCHCSGLSQKLSDLDRCWTRQCYFKVRMVSTRGVRVKFSEGERVLCYEPDPTKAKVLYDSKVLEVVMNKDGKGRKQVEYLIHFQGWNASWDRCVSEDFVLKDTDENRDLQRQLADRAQIKLSMKSNRVLIGGPLFKERKRKRRLSETIRETMEKERQERQRQESDTSSQTGTTEDDDDDEQEDGEEEEEEEDWDNREGEGSGRGGRAGGRSSSTGDEEEDGEEGEAGETTSDEETVERQFPLHLPDNLRAVLEQDFHHINHKNKLVDLPSARTALGLLDNYVRFFAAHHLPPGREKRRGGPGATGEPRDTHKAPLTLDLCKEVMDGLRVCFDFHIETLLLYAPERTQAHRLRTATPVYTNLDAAAAAAIIEEKEECDGAIVNKDEGETEETSRMKEEEKREDDKTKVLECGGRRWLRSKRGMSGDSGDKGDKNSVQPPATNANLTCESGRSTPTTITSGGSTVGGTGVGGCGQESLYPCHQPSSHHSTLLPHTHRSPPPPILIYGHTHLLRLFVKLPEILFRMNLPEMKKRVVLRHLHLFLEYMSNHCEELFGDTHYVTNTDL